MKLIGRRVRGVVITIAASAGMFVANTGFAQAGTLASSGRLAGDPAATSRVEHDGNDGSGNSGLGTDARPGGTGCGRAFGPAARRASRVRQADRQDRGRGERTMALREPPQRQMPDSLRRRHRQQRRSRPVHLRLQPPHQRGVGDLLLIRSAAAFGRLAHVPAMSFGGQVGH